MKKVFKILTLIMLILTILKIADTYAKYYTKGHTSSLSEEVGQWVIKVNDMDIYSEGGQSVEFSVTNISNFTNANAAPDKISPASEGYTNIIIDPTGTDVAVRYDIEKYYKVFNEIIDKFDLVITNQTNKKPHYVSPSDPLVVLLSEAYVKHSHDTVNKPFTVGGGTYASMMPKAVAFGPELPGEVVLAHQRDEYFLLDTFFMSVLIYIDAIIALGEIDA